MSDLYRLVYASKNHLQGTDAEVAEAVSQILAASQRNNAKVDVTGALMFNAGAFAQVLEGPQQGVESTFERIQCDPRHGDVTVLQCGPAKSRSFTNWSMAFVGQSATGRARWEGISAASGFDLTRLDGDAVFAMLHGLVLDEEGLPAAAPFPAEPLKSVDHSKTTESPRTGFDVERVRAELPQPGRAPQTSREADPVMRSHDGDGTPSFKHRLVTPAPASPEALKADLSKRDAVLALLRDTLAEERQRTTDLRNDLDLLRIALALEQQLSDEVRRERDLWAWRAQLLATALGQEADELGDHADQGEPEAPVAHGQGRPSASIKAVA
ncbi:BLUF domain-containing protein [Methylobacterium sp. E-016]|uniref:BLUF domain-containing protein n=1 Tax=Methylobacterium sp. E-016 TaxID=2836556 RepID=UPI001FB8E12C|nr:BLUF domain-containing protein [Methylobacterium sp. E-016]MCJ2075545.1 BLUF domain-containing protein [Methylobacterium sp. E-016]